MSRKYRSAFATPQFIPLIGKVVQPGEVFESDVELRNGNYIEVKEKPARPEED